MLTPAAVGGRPQGMEAGRVCSLERCWPNDFSSSPLVSRKSQDWDSLSGGEVQLASAEGRWAAFQSPHLQAGADSVSLLFLFYRTKCGWSELSQFRPVSPAGGRRYFFKKETKKPDRAQGVSLVAKYCLVVRPGMHERGDGGSWMRPGLQKGKASGRGVCVWKQGSWL